MPPPPTVEIKSMSAIKPLKTIRGHSEGVTGVAHLPDKRRIITSSDDGSLRLWNLDSGVQIGTDWRDDVQSGVQSGNDWRDDGKERIWSIALSPDGKTVTSGSSHGKIRLWDIETQKVVARWTGHTGILRSLCWSVDGEWVVSGSNDKTIRVWDVESGDTVLGPINTGHEYVSAVLYSPDATKIATGGVNETASKIWDAKTGNLLSTIKHDSQVWSLAWTSDQKKLITGDNDGWIRTFDTATWQQIAILDGHEHERHRSIIFSLSLFQNDRLLASASGDKTVRLWNLDMNLPVGPPIQHQDTVQSIAISADGMLLFTGCDDKNAYVWDIHTTLKDAGCEDRLSILNMPQNGLKRKVATRKSLMDTDATRRLAKHEYTYRLPPRFLDDAPDGVQSSAAPVTHPERRLGGFAPFSTFRRNALPSLFRGSQANTHEAIALQPLPRRSVFSRQRTRVVEVATAQDRQPLYVARRPEAPGDKGKDAQQQQGQIQASTSQHTPAVASTSSRHPPVNSSTAASAAGTQSQPPATGKNPPWWARLVFFACCASVPDGQ